MSNQTQYIQSVQLTESGWLVNGNMSVPNDPGNRHAQDVLAWIAEGNTPMPMHVPTEEEVLQRWRENTRVGPLQLRRALRQMGEMATVKTYMETQATEEEQEAWEYATTIPRLDPLVVGLQGILERTDEEVDQLFELALTFP